MEQKYMLRSKKGQTGLGAGVWNLGVGSDPFGGPVRESIPILDRLPLLAEAGMTYYEAHDSEIPAEQVEEAKVRAAACGISCGAAWPVFCSPASCQSWSAALALLRMSVSWS